MNFAHKFRRWNFNGLVGAEISCKNGRDIRCRGEDRAAFPLVATSREKAASRLRGRPPPVLFLGRKVAYPTSPQNLGANVFSPSPSQAAAICREGSFGDVSGLEKRRYLTLRQNWAHSCRARSCGLGRLETEIQTDPLLRRRPITTEAIGSAATHPSLRGALATKQSRGHNMRGASNPDGRTAAPGLLRFARNDGQGIGSLVSACRLTGCGCATRYRTARSYQRSGRRCV